MSQTSPQSAGQLEILEAISEAGGAINDDRIGNSGDALWVLDGATDQSREKLLPGGSDAAWIADAFSAAFLDLAPGFSGSLFELAEGATARVAARFEAEKLRPPAGRGFHPSAAGLLLRVRNGWAEVLGMGDSVLLASIPGAPVRLTGTDPARLGDRKAIERIARFAAETGLSWVQARDELHKRSAGVARAKMNLPGGYSVFSIDMPPRELVSEDHFPAPPGSLFLAMTDGFARLFDTFNAYTIESIMKAAARKSLAALAQELRAIETSDAECARFPRMKAVDDASAILARVI